jgi:hypothetical protein
MDGGGSQTLATATDHGCRAFIANLAAGGSPSTPPAACQQLVACCHFCHGWQPPPLLLLPPPHNLEEGCCPQAALQLPVCSAGDALVGCAAAAAAHGQSRGRSKDSAPLEQSLLIGRSMCIPRHDGQLWTRKLRLDYGVYLYGVQVCQRGYWPCDRQQAC